MSFSPSHWTGFAFGALETGEAGRLGGEKCDSAVRLSQCIRAFAVLGREPKTWCSGCEPWDLKDTS